MNREWKTEHCPYQPKEITADANGLYILRKDIHEEYHEASGTTPGYTDWACQMKTVTADEAIAYMIDAKAVSDERIAANKANIDYIAMMADIDLEVG